MCVCVCVCFSNANNKMKKSYSDFGFLVKCKKKLIIIELPTFKVSTLVLICELRRWYNSISNWVWGIFPLASIKSIYSHVYSSTTPALCCPPSLWNKYFYIAVSVKSSSYWGWAAAALQSVWRSSLSSSWCSLLWRSGSPDGHPVRSSLPGPASPLWTEEKKKQGLGLFSFFLQNILEDKTSWTNIKDSRLENTFL